MLVNAHKNQRDVLEKNQWESKYIGDLNNKHLKREHLNNKFQLVHYSDVQPRYDRKNELTKS